MPALIESFAQKHLAGGAPGPARGTGAAPVAAEGDQLVVAAAAAAQAQEALDQDAAFEEGVGTEGAFQGGRINSGSPWAGWYRFDTTQTDPDQQFKDWLGLPGPPELDKTNRSLRDFFYGDKNSVVKLWLYRGAAGWRMDVAFWVPDDFWREWRSAIKTHKPDALTVAET